MIFFRRISCEDKIRCNTLRYTVKAFIDQTNSHIQKYIK